MLGREQIYNPNYSFLEKIYIGVLGMPIVGLRIRARNIFSLIPKDREFNQILDAGSGPGVISFGLARRYPRAHITGIDLLEESILQCMVIADKLSVDNVVFHNTSIEDYKETKKHDLIITVDMLEHIEDDVAILKKMKQLLNDEGILLIHVPALHRRYPVFKKSINFDVSTHVRPGYSLSQLEKKVKEAGLKIKQSGYTYGFWETLSNNISYMITRADMQNKGLYAVAFPFLILVSLLGYRARPRRLGAGVYMLATR